MPRRYDFIDRDRSRRIFLLPTFSSRQGSSDVEAKDINNGGRVFKVFGSALRWGGLGCYANIVIVREHARERTPGAPRALMDAA